MNRMILFLILGVLQLTSAAVQRDCAKNGHRTPVGEVYIDSSNGICRTYFCVENNPPQFVFHPGNLKCSDQGDCYQANELLRKSGCKTWLCSLEKGGWDYIQGCMVDGTCVHHQDSVMTFDGEMCQCKRGNLICN